MQDTAEQCCKVLMDELQLFRTEDNRTKETENSEQTTAQFEVKQQSAAWLQ